MWIPTQILMLTPICLCNCFERHPWTGSQSLFLWVVPFLLLGWSIRNIWNQLPLFMERPNLIAKKYKYWLQRVWWDRHLPNVAIFRKTMEEDTKNGPKNVRKEMLEVVEEYSEYSTIQGIIYIFQAHQSMAGKIFWFLVIVAMIWLGTSWWA